MYVLLDFQKSLKEEVSVVDGMVYTNTHPPTLPPRPPYRAILSKGKFINYRRRTITKVYLDVSPVLEYSRILFRQICFQELMEEILQILNRKFWKAEPLKSYMVCTRWHRLPCMLLWDWRKEKTALLDHKNEWKHTFNGNWHWHPCSLDLLTIRWLSETLLW